MPRLGLVARTTAFAAAATYIIGGPIWTQVLRHPSTVLAEWTMFTNYGLDVQDVRYSLAAADGTLTPIDRYEVLGLASKAKAPTSLRTIPDLDAAQAVGRRLCRALPPGSDVRLRVRRATRRGWKVLTDNEENLCSTR